MQTCPVKISPGMFAYTSVSGNKHFFYVLVYITRFFYKIIEFSVYIIYFLGAIRIKILYMPKLEHYTSLNHIFHKH